MQSPIQRKKRGGLIIAHLVRPWVYRKRGHVKMTHSRVAARVCGADGLVHHSHGFAHLGERRLGDLDLGAAGADGGGGEQCTGKGGAG